MTSDEALLFLKEKYPVEFSRRGDVLTITFSDKSTLRITVVESAFCGRDAGEPGVPYAPNRSFHLELNDNVVYV